MVLTLIFGAFVQFGPRPKRLTFQSQWQENRHVFETYFRQSSNPAVLLVGTSLTKRLRFEDFSPCVYNLALDGGSALTGLSAILTAKNLPKRVFVEMNVPERTNDQELVDSTSGVLVRLSPIFWSENSPTNLAWNFMAGAKKPATALPGNDDVLKAELLRHQSDYAKPLSSDVLERSLARFRQLTGALEGRGVDVSFFEMPVHPSLEQAARAVQIRAAFTREFPRVAFLRVEDLAGNQTIHTVDGVHLTVGEAERVASRMAAHFQNVCTSAPSSS